MASNTRRSSKVANGLSSSGINSIKYLPRSESNTPTDSPKNLILPAIRNMEPEEDGDNRTRNAKAQRRHREKRKAHLKAVSTGLPSKSTRLTQQLEESVQVLTAQLDDARRQLGSNYYPSRPSLSGPSSPNAKESSTLQAENAYLREENNDLRRQLYAYRGAYGHGSAHDPSVKSDPFMYAATSAALSPKRQRRSGDQLVTASRAFTSMTSY